jgi:uncharacterized protein with NAD-binding domain and iron-sulfur cluster
MPTMNADVVIAGAGVAGLSCAAALADAGLRVLVFERAARPGGRAASWKDQTTGDTVDLGPHVLTNEHSQLLALLERLGTAGKVLWQPDPFITLLDRGRQLDISCKPWLPPLHGLPNLPNALSCVSPLDLMSNSLVVWQATRLSEAGTMGLDSEDALSYLRRMGVTARFIEWFWAPTVLSLLNVPLERCSAAAMMRLFRLMVGRSGYHFGFPRVGLSELFAPGCRHRVERAGGGVLLRAAVRELRVRRGRFQGFTLSDGQQVNAQCGVLALTPQAVAQLCERGDGAASLHKLAGIARRFEPCPYVSTLLWYDRKVTRSRFWARIRAAGDLNTDFYDLSNIRPQAAGAPSLIASNAIHAHEAWNWSDERIVKRTRREIAQFAPVARRAIVRHARVHRIPMAIHCPLPGSERLRPDNATPLPGMWLAGDWTATAIPCSMESAARSGALAAEAVAARFGRPLQLAKPPPETVGPVALLRQWVAPAFT